MILIKFRPVFIAIFVLAIASVGFDSRQNAEQELIVNFPQSSV